MSVKSQDFTSPQKGAFSVGLIRRIAQFPPDALCGLPSLVTFQQGQVAVMGLSLYSEHQGAFRKMTPEHPASGGTNQPVDPDLRSLGVHQPVILVADDEALIRNLVTLLLQHEGYFVLSAADGHEGLELSRKYPGPIDLVITDVQMPRLNGTDLCAHLIEERPGIKVLVMSGKDMSEIVRQNVHMPFLPKPFDGETLKARVRAILGGPHQAASGTERLAAPSSSAAG
jgi:CheY-like chemotaxis protein